MWMFKGRSRTKEYIKDKQIRWRFKYLYRCDSETGYVYQLELYQGRKEKRELNLGLSVVLALCQVLKDTYCHVFFDNLFNSSTMVQKLHDNGLYGHAVWLLVWRSDIVNIMQMKKDKEMKQGDYQCKFYNHIACIKWSENKYVMLLRKNKSISTV